MQGFPRLKGNKGKWTETALCWEALPATRKPGRRSEAWARRSARGGPLTYHGGPSRESSLGPLAEVVSRSHAQDGHLQPRVHIHAAWQHRQAVGIDGFDASGDNEVFSNLSESNRNFTGYKRPE